MISIILGIISMLFVFIGLIPLLGIMIWIALPFLVIGLACGIAGIAKKKRVGANTAGTVICALFLLIGGARLVIGATAMTKTATTAVEASGKANELSNAIDGLKHLTDSIGE